MSSSDENWPSMWLGTVNIGLRASPSRFNSMPAATHHRKGFFPRRQRGRAACSAFAGYAADARFLVQMQLDGVACARQRQVGPDVENAAAGRS